MGILKIPVDSIEEGMIITETDKKWLKLPFFNKPIEDKKKYIDLLKNYGVRYVFIESEEKQSQPNEATPIYKFKTSPQISVDLNKDDIDYQKYLKKLHLEYKEALKSIFIHVKMGKLLKTKEVKNIVKTYVNNYFKKPDLVINIARLKDYDEYTFMHSLNVCVLSIALGSRVGLDADNLNILGLGGLLHDIGKMKLSESLINKKGSYNAEEYNAVKKHPIYGYEILKENPEIPMGTLMAVLQHHENVDGSGYPLGLKDMKISKYAKIVSIVNAYDTLTNDTPYSSAVIPPKALNEILNNMGTQFDKLYVRFFIEILGIYPTGTTVLLNSGEIAVVFQVNRKEITSPKVIIVTDENKRNIKPYPFDLQSYNIVNRKPYKIIKEALDPKDYNIDPNKVIDEFLSTYT
jgi:putative nucleotidyltransferase with HDIG domain